MIELNIISLFFSFSYNQSDRDKSQSRRIQLTKFVISDGVVKREGLDSLTVKELVEGIVS